MFLMIPDKPGRVIAESGTGCKIKYDDGSEIAIAWGDWPRREAQRILDESRVSKKPVATNRLKEDPITISTNVAELREYIDPARESLEKLRGKISDSDLKPLMALVRKAGKILKA